MPLRRVAIASVLLLLLFAGLATALLREPAPPPFSSPTAIRTNQSYTRAHQPTLELPPFAGEIFASVSVELGPRLVSIIYPPGNLTNPPSSEFMYPDFDFSTVTVHRISSTQAVQIGDGSVRLAGLGMATAPPTRPHNFFSMSVPAKYYQPDLTPMPLEREQWPEMRRDLVAHRIPGAQFIFALSNITDFLAYRFQAFDARTTWPISGIDNLHPSSGSNAFAVTTSLTLWHQTPIELVGTFATGPVVRYPVPLAGGSELLFPGGAIKLLTITEGEIDQDNSFPRGTNILETYTIVRQRGRLPGPPEFSLLFYCWPRAFHAPIQFEFADHSGNLMHAFTRSISERIYLATVRGTSNQLGEIHLKHYPNLHRIVVTLPELPGLPEENRNLQNLFHSRIPYAAFAPHTLAQELGHLLQMKAGYISLSRDALQNAPRQIERTNTTALALLQELDRYRDRDHILVIDSANNKIETRRSLLARPISFLKRLFGGN